MATASELISKVTVVIVNFDTLHLTKPLLESLLACYPEIQIILVDNNSTDGSREWIERQAKEWKNVRYLLLNENITHGPGMDRGIRAARTPYILTLDSDTIVRKCGFIEPMAEAFLADGRLFAMGDYGHADITGTRPGNLPIVHPARAMYSRELYLKGRPFRHSGQPVAQATEDARKRNDHLKSFPLHEYIKHYGGGTRTIVTGRIMAQKARRQRGH